MKIFVYGTLMSGCARHDLLKNAEFIERGKVKGGLYALPMGYPALLANDEGCVEGELYEIDERYLAKLRYYEGVSGFGALYDEVLLDISCDDKCNEAICYVAKKSKIKYIKKHGALLENGIWKGDIGFGIFQRFKAFVMMYF